MRNTNARNRIVRILDADKETLNEASRRAATEDFTRVAEEYFETEGPVVLRTERAKGCLEVTVRFRVRRVKNFTTLK